MPEELSPIVEKAAESWPVSAWRDFPVMIAVSGGADSVALLRIIHRLHRQHPGRGSLLVAHVNHGLRGAASRQDAGFVAALAAELELDCHVETLPATDHPGNRGQGLESRLRDQRYRVLTELAGQRGARYLVTGHTWNDQVETVLFRVLRGTGLDGLAGIPARRRLGEYLTLVRPLLTIRRQEITDFLGRIRQPFRQDESNTSDRFTRNRLRHEVLPLLRDLFGNDVDQSLSRLANIAGETTAFLQRTADPLLAEHFTIQPGRLTVALPGLDSRDPVLVKVAVRRGWLLAGFPAGDMTSQRWNQMADLLMNADAAPGTPPETWPGNIRLTRSGDSLRWQRESHAS